MLFTVRLFTVITKPLEILVNSLFVILCQFLHSLRPYLSRYYYNGLTTIVFRGAGTYKDIETRDRSCIFHNKPKQNNRLW